MSRAAGRVRALTREQLVAWAEAHDTELLFYNPPEVFDGAIIGLLHGYGQEPAVLYDEAKVLAAMTRHGLSLEDAQEHFEFNTLGTFNGPATPRFLLDLDII